MNIHKKVEYLYPNNSNLFEYDTAKPHHVIENVLNELYPDLQPGTEEKAAKYRALNDSVYCYEKGSGREGFLPLSKQCREILEAFRRETGVNLIYTPVLSYYLEREEEKIREEFKELQQIDKFQTTYSYYKRSRMEGRTFEEIKSFLKI